MFFKKGVEMSGKSVLLILFFATFPLFGSDIDFVEKLFSQASVSLIYAKKQCSNLSTKNKTLIEAMSNVHKLAKEKGNKSTAVFAETDYLLNFLQERVEDACSKIAIADEESIKIIIASEINILLTKQKESANFEQFIDKTFGTEYSKFLYLTTTPGTLDKMHTEWGKKMSSNRKNMAEMVKNIAAANKDLREELTTFTKSYKLYYEGAELKHKAK
ncbi:MAG: hypothetical protein ACOX2F_05665 [bacterium]